MRVLSSKFMNSFRIVYDSEGDIFDVNFRLTPTQAAEHGYELNENVVIWTDAKLTRVHRLMFISYSKLLERPNLKLSLLKKLSAPQRNKIQRALGRDAVARFLVCRNKDKVLYALVGPDVESMVKAA